MNVLKFEFKKLWRSRLFVIFLLLSIGLVLGLFARNFIYQDIIKAEKMSQIQQYSFNVRKTVIIDESELQEMGEEGDPVLEEEIEAGRALYSKLDEWVEAIDEDQALAALQLENEAYELAIYYHELNKQFPLSVSEMEAEMTLNHELIRIGLPKEDLHTSIQPAVFSKQVVLLFFNSFGFFILIVLMGLPIVKEFDDQTVKLTYGLPISPLRMVLAKWLMMIISAVIWFVSVIGTTLLISSWLGKGVDQPFNYPFDTQAAGFIQAGDYLQQAIGYGLLYLMMLVTWFTFFSFLLKRSLLVQCSLFSLFIMAEITISQGFINQWFPWLYQKLDVAITQTIAGSGLAVVANIACTIVLLLLSIAVSKRRGHV